MSAFDAYSIPPLAWRTFTLVQQMIDGLPDPIFAKDLQSRIVAGNTAVCELIGRPHTELIGKSDYELFPREQAEHFELVDSTVARTQEPFSTEELLTDASGVMYTLWTRKFPLYDDTGTVIGVCGVITNISAIRQREARVEQLEALRQEQLAVIESQKSLLDQLAVPVIQVWEGVLLLPLVGAIDDRRAGRITESLLDAITHASAEYVLLDLTGVPLVDTAVASYILRAVQAAKLLGCRSVLVGISAEIAQTLVGLGVDFSAILTRATLQQGLAYALDQLSYTVQRSRTATAPQRAAGVAQASSASPFL